MAAPNAVSHALRSSLQVAQIYIMPQFFTIKSDPHIVSAFICHVCVPNST